VFCHIIKLIDERMQGFNRLARLEYFSDVLDVSPRYWR